MQQNRAQETPEASTNRRIFTRIRNKKARVQETAEKRTIIAAFQTGKNATKQSTRNSRKTY
jgi:hypothetical protein